MRTFVVVVFGAVLMLSAVANWAIGTAFSPQLDPFQIGAARS